jgi:hypothetical protein
MGYPGYLNRPTHIDFDGQPFEPIHIRSSFIMLYPSLSYHPKWRFPESAETPVGIGLGCSAFMWVKINTRSCHHGIRWVKTQQRKWIRQKRNFISILKHVEKKYHINEILWMVAKSCTSGLMFYPVIP